MTWFWGLQLAVVTIKKQTLISRAQQTNFRKILPLSVKKHHGTNIWGEIVRGMWSVPHNATSKIESNFLLLFLFKQFQKFVPSIFTNKAISLAHQNEAEMHPNNRKEHVAVPLNFLNKSSYIASCVRTDRKSKRQFKNSTKQLRRGNLHDSSFLWNSS